MGLPARTLLHSPWLSCDDDAMNTLADLEDLKQRLRSFVAERDWAKFHSPKNLAMALSVEVAELVEQFQWLTESQSAELDDARRRRVEDELADVLVYLVRLADQLDVDLLAVTARKLQDNARKYPADQVRGQARKYDDY
jgi:dCTP diphosphatase